MDETSRTKANNPYGCTQGLTVHTHTHKIGVKPLRGRGRLMVLVFCTLNSMRALFLPRCAALSVVEKLKWIFQLCLLNHCYILTLVHKVVLAQPAIISITR